jgi:hypothetical protein
VQIGLPQILYCSPLTRCLVTNAISFGFEVYNPDVNDLSTSGRPPSLNTVDVEVSAETFTWSLLTMYESGIRIVVSAVRRKHLRNDRPRHTFSEMFTKFSIEEGFTDDDEIWKTDEKETWKAVRQSSNI